MKTKSFLAGIGLLTAVTVAAQPNPLYFNTAVNSTLNGKISINANDKWEVAYGTIGSTYYPAKRCSLITGWYASVNATADWVTYPNHNCSGATQISEHWCLQSGPVMGDVDEFYKISFELPSTICGWPITIPDVYKLTMKYWADNVVYKIYVNNTTTAAWTNTGFISTYNSNDNHSSAGAGNVVTLNSGWQSGVNTIYVHVKSGAPGNTGWTGFMTQVDVSNTTYTDSPCPEIGSGCCLGNACGDEDNNLTSDYEIPLNGYNFYFPGDQTQADKVNVGYNCGAPGLGKLNSLTHVKTNNLETSGNSPESAAIYGKSEYSGRQQTSAGVFGEAENKESGNSYGVWGRAFGAEFNIGGNFYAEHGSKYNIGVSGVAMPSTGNIPIPSYVAYYPSANIGVYGAGEPNNSDDDGNPQQDWAGWFDGDVYIDGTGYYTGMSVIMSDKRFKKDIGLIDNASDIIGKLRPANYFMKVDNEYGLSFSNKKQFGFISQEVETVLPDLVENVHRPALLDKTGKVARKEVDYKALNYTGFIALLTKGMQEQQAKIAEQQTQIESQQKQINELKTLVESLAANTKGAAGIPVTLGSNAVVLNQNVPNPFAESTVITYNIPTDFSRAQILFTTSEGKVIKTVDITQKGPGSLNVFANDLTHGIYSYSLVIDGKTVDTKKMIKE